MSSARETAIPQLGERGAAALTEVMTVLEGLPAVAGDSERFAVVSSSGREYHVDLRAETCDCHDMIHRRPTGGCKHIQRVRLARGETVIPSWVNIDAIEDDLGQHVTGTPLVHHDGRAVPLEELRADDEPVTPAAAGEVFRGP